MKVEVRVKKVKVIGVMKKQKDKAKGPQTSIKVKKNV